MKIIWLSPYVLRSYDVDQGRSSSVTNYLLVTLVWRNIFEFCNCCFIDITFIGLFALWIFEEILNPKLHFLCTFFMKNSAKPLYTHSVRNKVMWQDFFNPFLPNVLFWFNAETYENLWFSNVFRGNQKGTFRRNGLINMNKTVDTAQKMKFCIRDFFITCDQIRRKLRIWSHLLKNFLMENIIFCTVW